MSDTTRLSSRHVASAQYEHRFVPFVVIHYLHFTPMPSRAMASTNPDRAERIARSIANEFHKERALREVAKTLASTSST